MWGREPHRVQLKRADREELEHLVRDGHTEQRAARRAQILLAIAQPDAMVEEVADQWEVARTTVWRVCRRYEERGLRAVYDAERAGRPLVIPPLGESANRAVGLL